MRGGGPPFSRAMLEVVGICWRRGDSIKGGPPRLPPRRARAWAWRAADGTEVLAIWSLGVVSSPAARERWLFIVVGERWLLREVRWMDVLYQVCEWLEMSAVSPAGIDWVSCHSLRTRKHWHDSQKILHSKIFATPCAQLYRENYLTLTWRVLAVGVSVGSVDNGQLHQLSLLQLILAFTLKKIIIVYKKLIQKSIKCPLKCLHSRGFVIERL